MTTFRWEMGRSWACTLFADTHLDKFAPASQFLTDLTRGNLPSVVEIDPGFATGLDEHAGTDPTAPSGRIQTGSAKVATLINALMKSLYWKESVFILTWDEGGGFYDHVPPQPMPSPDGIKPSTSIDLLPGAICTTGIGLTCDFVYTGYRVPLIVISPFSKKNCCWALFPRKIVYEDGSTWEPQQHGECFQVYWRDKEHPDLIVLPPALADVVQED